MELGVIHVALERNDEFVGNKGKKVGDDEKSPQDKALGFKCSNRHTQSSTVCVFFFTVLNVLTLLTFISISTLEIRRGATHH